jgi:hypothetical protein
LAVDNYGITKIFPDRVSGKTLIQESSNFTTDYSQHGYASLPGVQVWRKTFAFTSSGSKLLNPNQEVTIYVYLPSLNPEYNSDPNITHCKLGSGMDIKLRGGFHTSTGSSSAHCYIFHYEYEGGDCNDFQKEYPHPKYYKNTIAEDNSFTNWIGRAMGFKVITLNTPDNKNVEFWCYFDPSAVFDSNGKIVFTNDWKLRYHGIDSGQYGLDQAKPQFTTTWGKYTEFRLDNAPNMTKAFYTSLREIQRS